MLSILIPIYDYDAYALVLDIEAQALKSQIVFEIVCVDDGSFSSLNEKNQNINSLSHCKFIESKTNRGRIATRKFLAKSAQYDWLLFIDCDVALKSEQYIKNYIKEMTSKNDAVFGGFAYKDYCEDYSKSLRYTFGKKREEVLASIRNKKPYKTIISSNFLIKKSVFLEVSEAFSENRYGLDYYFGAHLKDTNKRVKHIDNEVYHLGIDKNDAFIDKTKKAVDTLHYLHKNKLIKNNDISLLKAYKLLKNLYLNRLFGKLIYGFKKPLERNLKSKTPNLFLFDIYRLGYLCVVSC